MLRIVIVEDEPAIARGLSTIITQNHPDFQVVALCRNGKDGMNTILEEKPELVFTDINMPSMNGLDMIKNIHQAGFEPHFVILTGYAEFEYARTAMRLGVSDYLLKPISPDALNEILHSFSQQQNAATRLLQAEYLQRCLDSQKKNRQKENPLQSCSCTLFFIFSGPLCGNTYYDSLIAGNPIHISDAHLQEIEALYNVSLFPLQGHHYNEAIFAMVTPLRQNTDTQAVAQALYQACDSSDSYLNMVISDSSKDGRDIYDLKRNTYFFALLNHRFAHGSIQKYEPTPDQEIHVSQEIKQICSSIPKQPEQDSISKIIHFMLSFWKEKETTQFQLVTDLRYFISAVIHDYSEENIVYPDANEIVSSSTSYEALENELQFEIERIFNFNKKSIPESQQSLAWQVRSWLDRNFTAQISCKIFQDIFGYNEKYISSLFKSEFGISPSKYIGELRLNTAKKLIQNNPDILLKDVSEMVGYTDAFYFSRVFKSREGISPNQYIKQIKEQVTP